MIHCAAQQVGCSNSSLPLAIKLYANPTVYLLCKALCLYICCFAVCVAVEGDPKDKTQGLYLLLPRKGRCSSQEQHWRSGFTEAVVLYAGTHKVIMNVSQLYLCMVLSYC
jgi:hypothetical protein